MVFGNAVAVPLGDLVVIGAVALVCAAVHALFAKELAFTSFDPETALALGMRVKVWDAVLFLTIGLAIPVTARALGALPVFAFLTLPAAAALMLKVGFRPAFAVAAGIGVAPRRAATCSRGSGRSRPAPPWWRSRRCS